MAIFARRREVSVMKLVGATNWFRATFPLCPRACSRSDRIVVGSVVVYFVYLFINHEGSSRTTSNIFSRDAHVGVRGLAPPTRSSSSWGWGSGSSAPPSRFDASSTFDRGTGVRRPPCGTTDVDTTPAVTLDGVVRVCTPMRDDWRESGEARLGTRGGHGMRNPEASQPPTARSPTSRDHALLQQHARKGSLVCGILAFVTLVIGGGFSEISSNGAPHRRDRPPSAGSSSGRSSSG